MAVAESDLISESAGKEESDLTPIFDDETQTEQLAEQPRKEDISLDDNVADLTAIDKLANVDDENKDSAVEESTALCTTDNTEKEAVIGEELYSEQDSSSEEEINEAGKEHVQKTQESPSDINLIAQADEYVRKERLLEAARALRRVQDISLFEESHWKTLTKAEHVEAAVVDLTSAPDDGWTKQGESHGNYDTIIYYKVDESARLTARIETPIESSLLVPLLSVFNESELYESWMPHMNGLGLSRSIKLRQTSRANQIILVTSHMPWPFDDREAAIEATAVDDISTNNHIVVKLETRYEGEEDGLVPPPEGGVVRVDLDGGILFRKCPEDHPAFAKSMHPDHKGPLVLVCFTMFVDAHVQYVPQKLINFVTRTVIGRIWSSLLEVAEAIRDGKRPQHADAIATKSDLYEWIEQRVQVMIDSIDETESIAAA